MLFISGSPILNYCEIMDMNHFFKLENFEINGR